MVGLTLFALLCIPWTGFASFIILYPSADTTLSENYPSNNFGGLRFVNAGTTQNRTMNRGLFQFGIAASLPAGSRIQAASLILEVTHLPEADYAFADFGLHRVLKPWGEGSGVTGASAPGAGVGRPAITNEANWFDRFAFTTNSWATLVGAPTNDYMPETSSIQTIYGLGDSPYTFVSTARMIADVQQWLDDPQTNFGWMLKPEAEETPFTARRFASREDPDFPPQLELYYVAPPRIDSAERVGSQFKLYFSAEAGQGYAVEFASRLSATNTLWSTLTNIPPPATTTDLVISDSGTGSNRFYRLRTQ
ncbi:MAG: hypothetical protein JWR69_2398 [Pedosphaera sp.]|nr:hypothetical protein [Pedosphaera sp.]